MRDNKRKLNGLILEVQKQMQEKTYGRKMYLRYQHSFHLLATMSEDMGKDVLSDELIKAFLNSPMNCSEKWAGKELTHRKRCIRLLSSLAQTGTIAWEKQKPKDISSLLRNEPFRLELKLFSDQLYDNGLSSNTICGYKRMVTYFLIFCQNNGYGFLSDIKSDDVSRFIISLYRDGRYHPTIIGSSLSDLRMFLSRHKYTEPLTLEIPVHLPRSRNIIEVYSTKDLAAIETLLLSGKLTKRDTAICRILLETGLRGTDICSLRLEDIDWKKDTIYIIQDKTRKQLILPLRATYGNAIFDYIVTERPKGESECVFLRSLAPYHQLGTGAIYPILEKMEILAGIQKEGRITGSRMTRHNAASAMLRAGVPMSDISATLGHRDPNIVSVYLSTDAESLAACTLRLPSAGEGGTPDEG